MALAEKVREAIFVDLDPDLVLHLLDLNAKNRMAFVGDNHLLAVYEHVLKAIGRNAIVGNERFFWSPYFWEFHCEKAAILAKTLEVMKAGGMIYNYMAKAESMDFTIVSTHAKKNMVSEGTEKLVDDLFDNLCPEAFCLFLYGMTLSVTGAALEYVVVTVTRKLEERRDGAVQCIP